MNTLIKMITLMMILNIFMYLAVNFAISADQQNELNKDIKFYFENDMLSQLFSNRQTLDNAINQTKQGYTSYSPVLNSNSSFNSIPEQQGGVLQGSGVNFLDALKIIWAFILTLANMLQAPLTLFFNFRMPIFIGLMIGVPYFVILVMSLMALIRGVGD